jgi:hypothetical protein
MTPLELSEEVLETIERIKKEAIRYTRRHRKMPLSMKVTKEELNQIKEARKAGIYPEIIFKGKSEPVNIKYGGY